MFLDFFIPFRESTLEREGRSKEISREEHGRHLPQGDTLKTKLLLASGIILSLSAFAQTNSQTSMAVEPMSVTPVFRVNVISRTARAVNYQHRGGATKVNFA